MSSISENIERESIADKLKTSMVDYGMSVIHSRAIPDVRDGLKPVQRRILYGMNEEKNTADKPYRKSAKTVGNVIGNYHPHGDSSVYEALVRMTQDWLMREPLVDGHGNFGSMDGDKAAAMRYTEARLQKLSHELLRDLDPEIVPFDENYDGSETEPQVLPAHFPNILVNGVSGIAYGLATSIPTHNLKEVIDATISQIDYPEITTEELMEHIKGPDFPTGGTILGKEDLKTIYETGKGSFTVRGRTKVLEENGKQVIYIEEIPYRGNKKEIENQIIQIQKDWNQYVHEKSSKKKGVVKEKGFDFIISDGVKDLTDRNNQNGTVSIRIQLKKGVSPEEAMNVIFSHTPLQTKFSVNAVVLKPTVIDGKQTTLPEQLPLKDILKHYINHQEEVFTRKYELMRRKKEARMHKLEGFIKALSKLDEAIRVIQDSETRSEAKDNLMELLTIDEVQADFILDMRLHKLTGGDQQQVRDEHDELKQGIMILTDKLENRNLLLDDIKEDLKEVRDKYGNDRRTEILDEKPSAFSKEDFIRDDEMVVTMTHKGFVKRTLADSYRTQKRKGFGKTGTELNDGDFATNLHVANNKDYMLFFTSKGRVYKRKVYDIPEAGSKSKGQNIRLFLDLEDDEEIQSVMSVSNFDSGQLLFTTRGGITKKTDLSLFTNIRSNGIIAVDLKNEDQLVSVQYVSDHTCGTVITRNGKSITFDLHDLPSTSRSAKGSPSINLDADDFVVSSIIHSRIGYIFVATESGFGKRSSLSDYKVQKRNGKGIATVKETSKGGKVVGSCYVDNDDTLLLMSQSGTIIKIKAKDVFKFNRVTQGTELIKLRKDDRLSYIFALPKE